MATSPVTEALYVSGVDAYYGDSHVLHDVSFTLEEGHLLGLLGRRAARGREGEPPFQPVPDPGDGSWFPETGHTLRDGFRAYWTANGGLAVFGFPISEPFEERNADDGLVYTVQYFERNRFEYHPELAGTPYEILLGQLGRQALGRP